MLKYCIKHIYSTHPIGIGKYTITVTVAITVFQQTASGTGTITVVPDYTINVKNIKPTTGQVFSGIVAMGTDPFPNDPLKVTIDWGDKTTPTSQQVVSSANGAYQVSAMHTYSQAGSWTITVSLSSFLVGPLVGTGTATVVAPAFTLSARNITSQARHKFSGTVATVTGTISAKGLSVTINWGDGASNVLSLGGGKGTFSVKSSHTYSKAGRYPITISVKDNGTGQTATGTGTATVA